MRRRGKTTWGCDAVRRKLRRLEPPTLALCVLALLLVSACSVRRGAVRPGRTPPDRCAVATNQEKLRELLASRDSRDPRNGDYVVAPGDMLVVTIYNYRPEGGDFVSSVRVDDRGFLSLPMIEPVAVAGKTLSDVRRLLVHRLRGQEVLREPLVSVFLKEYEGHRVVVLGAVAAPGTYSLKRGENTLIDVLSMAGGLTGQAGNYILFRPGNDDAETRVSRAQAYAVTAVGGLDPLERMDTVTLPICLDTPTGEPNPVLFGLAVRGGDLIIVPEAGQAFIEGEVAKGGPYPLHRGMTVTQLISSAGGLSFAANPRKVRLVRQVGTEGVGEWELDVEKIYEQKSPDVRLDRNDRVIVPYRPAHKVVQGVYRFVTAIVRITVGGALTVF